MFANLRFATAKTNGFCMPRKLRFRGRGFFDPSLAKSKILHAQKFYEFLTAFFEKVGKIFNFATLKIKDF
jgi:hypothetical protein